MGDRHIIRGGSRTSDRDVFEYALLRVVPRIERGEHINAGVLVYCRAQGYAGTVAGPPGEVMDHTPGVALTPGVRAFSVMSAEGAKRLLTW